MKTGRFALVILPLLLGHCAHSPKRQTAPSKSGRSAKTAPDKSAPARSEPAADKDGDIVIKSYASVITKEAKSQPGIFTVHRVKDKYYYEIPKKELGREFLWNSRIARTTVGVGFGGQSLADYVVRWERRQNQVLLRSVTYESVADPSLPIARAVEAAKNEAILMVFPIKALGKDDAPVIDISPLFTKEVSEFSAKQLLKARSFENERSFLERVSAFQANLEVEATHTYTLPNDTGRSGSSEGRPSSATVLMHYSMIKLPERPMIPRLFDDRVGYFTLPQYDYGREEQRAIRRKYIYRWRLEKKDPTAAVSDPMKPIIYVIDPATPKKWIPYLKRGIEKWRPALAAAGFSNAIFAAEAPSPTQDPTWSPEDARYSVVRWLPTTVQNAKGPSVIDPRTGEILQADIEFHHNVMKIVANQYFTQVSPLDPRARKFPFPDDLMGSLLEYVIMHEVGHTLGLQHNFKASSTYPAAKLRDSEWLKKMGYTPSVMDYSRFNYVAQPEDQIDVAELRPRIGPYDIWAIKWGYTPIPGTRTPDDEKPVLNQWTREQDQVPWLRFSTAQYLRSPLQSDDADTSDLEDVVGDADPVASTGLGVKNLRRVMDLLLTAVDQNGESFEELASLFEAVTRQWSTEMEHVIALVGGFDSIPKHVGQDGPRFTPVSRERQVAAMQFLNQDAFVAVDFLIRPELMRLVGLSSGVERLRRLQSDLLKQLLGNERLSRLVDQETTEGTKAYHPTEFLADVRKGIWRELLANPVLINVTRRNLQRAYVELLGTKLDESHSFVDDTGALLRGELVELKRELERALPRATERVTRLHLQDAQDRINKVLEPRRAAPN